MAGHWVLPAAVLGVLLLFFGYVIYLDWKDEKRREARRDG